MVCLAAAAERGGQEQL